VKVMIREGGGARGKSPIWETATVRHSSGKKDHQTSGPWLSTAEKGEKGNLGTKKRGRLGGTLCRLRKDSFTIDAWQHVNTQGLGDSSLGKRLKLRKKIKGIARPSSQDLGERCWWSVTRRRNGACSQDKVSHRRKRWAKPGTEGGSDGKRGESSSRKY